MVHPHKWSPSATGRAQDRESSPAKDRHSNVEPHKPTSDDDDDDDDDGKL